MTGRKQVYIAHTGGTIGMQKTARGYVPVRGHLQEQMQAMAVFRRPEMPAYKIHEYEPPIDSANMSPAIWRVIAEDIAAHHDEFDGFVVLHGTDTMAYTASALPFMLHRLRKPVILTGGQIPLCEVRNDSRENLVTAMLIAAHHAIPEVCLFFGSKLLRGNRATKIDAYGFEAFDSPNFMALGSAGLSITVKQELLRKMPRTNKPVAVKRLDTSRVAALRLFPGLSAEVVGSMLKSSLAGLVLETYGIGNGPSNDARLLDVLGHAVAEGKVIVNCSQCLKGMVRMGAYETGQAFARIGLISGHDMTIEAALAKMGYLFSQNRTVEKIKRSMQKNLKGEMTVPK